MNVRYSQSLKPKVYLQSRQSQNRQGVVLILLVLTLLTFDPTCLLSGNSFMATAFGQLFPTPGDREPYGTIFSGQVVSTFGRPIGEALVEVSGKITQTNEKGFFQIAFWTQIDPNWIDPFEPNWIDPFKPEPNEYEEKRYVLNISKQGYGPVSKVYNTSVKDGLWVMTPATVVNIDPTVDNFIRDMRPSSVCTGTLSSRVDWSRYRQRREPYRVNSQGQYVGPASAEAEHAAWFAEHAGSCNEGISVRLPANSLVDSQGNLVSGEATISLSTVDIYDPTSMPGDYTVDLGDQRGYMITYGAGTISASSNGKSLQLRKDAKATLIIPIHQAQLEWTKRLDPNIPCLRYDERSGMWYVVGEGVLDPDNRAYVAEIDHFSAYNMDLVKTDQACVRIDSSAIDEDYSLEVSIPFEGDTIVRTVSVDNTSEKIHVIYNLPSNTEIVLQAFRETNGEVIPITDRITVDTSDPQNPQTPNRPDYPYEACNGRVTLTTESVGPSGPTLSGPGASSGTFTLIWEYDWPMFGSNHDGYQLEESTTSATSGFSNIYDTTETGDHHQHVEYELTRTTGDYWYRVRAWDEVRYQGQPDKYSPYSNVVHVAVNTTPAQTITRFVNDSSYMLVSLILDGTQYIPAPGNSILPGYYLDFEVSAGQHSVEIKNGFWDGNSRFEMYVVSGDYVQPSGEIYTITFSDPTINSLLTQFNNTGLWSGTFYDSNYLPHTRSYRFSANGTWTRWVDNVYNDSGTYTELSRDPSSFSVTFSTGQHQGTYYELWSYFIMRDGPSSWPLIEYYYQGQ